MRFWCGPGVRCCDAVPADTDGRPADDAGRAQPQRIAELARSANGLLHKHLAELTDADLMTHPPPGANHGRGPLVHLARFQGVLAKLVSVDPPFAPAGRLRRSGRQGHTAEDDVAEF